MNTRFKLALSMLCSLGIYTLVQMWLWVPTVYIPKVGRAFGPEDMKRFAQLERQQRHYISEVLAASAIYERYGCDEWLAERTAKYAIANGIPARVVAADVVVESGCHSDIVSQGEAVGLMQVVPSVHHISRRDLMDPETNLQAGTRILARYTHEHGNIHDGLRFYFGVTEGSDASEEYANKVLAIAWGSR